MFVERRIAISQYIRTTLTVHKTHSPVPRGAPFCGLIPYAWLATIAQARRSTGYCTGALFKRLHKPKSPRSQETPPSEPRTTDFPARGQQKKQYLGALSLSSLLYNSVPQTFLMSFHHPVLGRVTLVSQSEAGEEVKWMGFGKVQRCKYDSGTSSARSAAQ